MRYLERPHPARYCHPSTTTPHPTAPRLQCRMELKDVGSEVIEDHPTALSAQQYQFFEYQHPFSEAAP